jgi:pimeloyl-ACP methyl ester carboxylesterase
LIYADLFPDKVGRFIIDSAVDPKLRAIELVAGTYAVYEATMLDFFSRCDASRTCQLRPNAVSRYDVLLAKATQTPFRGGGYVLTRAGLESLALFMVRSGQDAALAKFLSELERNDASSLGEIVRFFDRGLPDINDLIGDPDGDGMYFEMACKEGFHSSSSIDAPQAKFDLIVARAPRFRAAAADVAASQVCTWWGAKTDTRPVPVAKPGVPPMLFLAYNLDSVTPAEWTRSLATRWPGSAYVETLGLGHGVLPNSACVQGISAAFVLTGALPAPNSCPRP